MTITENTPLPDGGIRYTETNMSHAIPEPLNTLSSCLFILLALYWFLRIYRERNDPAGIPVFLLVCTIILFTGSIGGTLYHGLRRYRIFLFMDYMPIMILCLLAGIWFLSKVLEKWYYALIILVVYAVLMWVLRTQLGSQSRHVFININYAMLALLVLVPTLLLLAKNKWQGGRLVAIALMSFIVALVFRAIDPLKLLPVGTHFLWHTFGAIATACMLAFVYQIDNLIKSDQTKQIS